MSHLLCLAALTAVAQTAIEAHAKYGSDEVVRQPPSFAVAPAVTGISGVSVALSRADVAMARASVVPNLFKGAFGEAHMQRYLTGFLRETGGWHPLSARLGSQGIDGMYLKFDQYGHIRGLIVSEAKYGSSTLQMTRDGLQMSKPWLAKRLTGMAKEYLALADAVANGEMRVVSPSPAIAAQRLQIPMPDGTAAVFWRENASSPWKFAGPKALLREVGNRCKAIAEYTAAAGSGRVAYRAYVYRVGLDGINLRVQVRDASGLDAFSVDADLPIVRQLTIPLTKGEMNAIHRMSRTEVTALLRRKFPRMSQTSIESYADDVTRIGKPLQSLFAGKQVPLFRHIAANGLKGAVGGALLAPAVTILEDYSTTGRVDIDRACRSAGVAFVAVGTGSVVGQGSAVLIATNPTFEHLATRTATALRVGSGSVVANATGAVFGGTVTSLLFAYGGYFAGLHDLRTANRTAVAGVAGVTGGVAFSAGALAAVGTFATASTGTAISTLSGAAATNASIAWIGGGSIAAGGGGMAAGTLILASSGFAVAVALPVAVMYGFHLHDQRQETIRIGLFLDHCIRRKNFTYNPSMRF